MKTDADLHARIADLEDKLECAYAEINSLQGEIAQQESELDEYRYDPEPVSALHEFVADAIHRRDVLGLDDGDVLSIIHEKLRREY